MPAPKSLQNHVLAGTFRPSRHHKLLAGPTVGWPALAAIQGAYAAATSEPERRAAAVAFLEAVRDLTDEETAEEPQDPFSEELERIFALPPVPMPICDDERAVDRYYRAMEAAKLADVGVPVREIAERLPVSETTIRRDLHWLEQFNLPDWLRPRQKGRQSGAARARRRRSPRLGPKVSLEC